MWLIVRYTHQSGSRCTAVPMLSFHIIVHLVQVSSSGNKHNRCFEVLYRNSIIHGHLFFLSTPMNGKYGTSPQNACSERQFVGHKLLRMTLFSIDWLFSIESNPCQSTSISVHNSWLWSIQIGIDIAWQRSSKYWYPHNFDMNQSVFRSIVSMVIADRPESTQVWRCPWLYSLGSTP